MKRMRIIGLSIVAALAMSAVVASGASAATTLTLKTAGKAITAGDVIKSDSSDLTTVTEAGNLECTENELLTTVTANGAVKDFGNVTAEKSTGLEAPPGACKTTTVLGPALITSSGLPWKLELASNGKGKVKKNPSKVTFTATFPAAGGAKCVFEAATVKVTFPKLKPAKGKKETGPALVLTTTNALFKLNKKPGISNPACPKDGKLSGHFNVTAFGEPVLPEFSS